MTMLSPDKLSPKPNSNAYSKFVKRLSNSQKNILALSLTTLIVSGIGLSWFVYKNPNYIDSLLGRNDESENSSENRDRPALRKALANLDETLQKVSNDSVLYQTINFEELPVYPQTWVESHFDSNEINNALIGGESGDPDNDGLSNKQEYLYGSNPRNSDSLCDGKVDNVICFGRTDKENVDLGISPLTGLELDTPKRIKLKKQDFAVVDKLQSSFETASEEGVDFPSLYQLSRQIDLSDEFDKVQVLTIDTTAESILEYQQFRIEILGEFAEDNELTSFTRIYELSTEEEFDDYIQQYSDIQSRMGSTQVPSRYANAHKAYVMLFQKLVDLVQHRKSGVMAGVINEEFREKSRKLSTEMVWSYRRLNEELTKSTTSLR
ncbi:MAG: hypothetical protein AAGF07_01390 [Patescibacteria group bacterium]